MTILIKEGHVLDPETKRDEICDVLIDGDRITRVGRAGHQCKGVLRHAGVYRSACTFQRSGAGV